MKNEKHLKYSFEHRQAFIFVLNKLPLHETYRTLLEKRAKNHDLDKMFLYTLISKKDASRYHKVTSSHHAKQAETTIDLLEAIVDWECSGYTKPDKPMNAYDTLIQLETNFPHRDEMLQLMEKLDIAYSYKNTPDNKEWQEFKQQLPEYSEELVMLDIYKWALRNKQDANLALSYAQSV